MQQLSAVTQLLFPYSQRKFITSSLVQLGGSEIEWVLLKSELLAGEVGARYCLGQPCARPHLSLNLEVIFFRVALANLDFVEQFGGPFQACSCQVKCAESTSRAHGSIKVVDRLVIGRELFYILGQILEPVRHALQV